MLSEKIVELENAQYALNKYTADTDIEVQYRTLSVQHHTLESSVKSAEKKLQSASDAHKAAEQALSQVLRNGDFISLRAQADRMKKCLDLQNKLTEYEVQKNKIEQEKSAVHKLLASDTIEVEALKPYSDACLRALEPAHSEVVRIKKAYLSKSEDGIKFNRYIQSVSHWPVIGLFRRIAENVFGLVSHAGKHQIAIALRDGVEQCVNSLDTSKGVQDRCSAIMKLKSSLATLQSQNTKLDSEVGFWGRLFQVRRNPLNTFLSSMTLVVNKYTSILEAVVQLQAEEQNQSTTSVSKAYTPQATAGMDKALCPIGDSKQPIRSLIVSPPALH